MVPRRLTCRSGPEETVRNMINTEQMIRIEKKGGCYVQRCWLLSKTASYNI